MIIEFKGYGTLNRPLDISSLACELEKISKLARLLPIIIVLIKIFGIAVKRPVPKP